MSSNQIGQAVAKRDNSPSALVTQYKGDFATMLPSHVNADQWARVAIGAIRQNRDLEEAAKNDVGAFLHALSTAARLGLEPGTNQFWLIPRKDRGVAKVQGIVGYEGLIELIYRAGAVSSIIAEVVYVNDRFSYMPGRDDRPQHEIDWDSSDRGDLRLAYAYAIMKDGAVSKVVVLNRADIERIKRSSQGADSKYSPWVNHEAAMWLKSTVRQLAKWVPTSAEYRKEQLRAVHEVNAEMEARAASQSIIPAATTPELGEGEHMDPVTGEIFTGETEDDPDRIIAESADVSEVAR